MARRIGRRTRSRSIIDFDGIDQRVVSLPIPAGDISNLQAGAAGQVYYLQAPATRGEGPRAQPFSGSISPTQERTGSEPMYSTTPLPRDSEGARRQPRGPGSRCACSVQLSRGQSSISAAGRSAGSRCGWRRGARGGLNLDAVEVRVDPRAEWPQIFDEAWRINRDYFYDPKHARRRLARDEDEVRGVPAAPGDRAATSTASSAGCSANWPSATATLAPANGLRRQGPRPRRPARGRLRDRRRPLPLQEGLRRPELEPGAALAAHRPGVEVKAGEYLLAVRGMDLKPPTEVYSLFEGTRRQVDRDHRRPEPRRQGQPDRDRRAARQRVRAAQPGLGRGQPQEGPRRRPAAAWPTSTCRTPPGRATSTSSATSSRRPTRTRSSSTSASTAAARWPITTSTTCAGRSRPLGDALRRDFRTPGGAIFGPKVMLIDETAGSGGDLLPWMFRQYKLGPLVGKRTWGGLVGILGFPVLMDGGSVTAPNLAFWTAKDGFGVENVGVPPDIEVEQWPADVDRRQGPAAGEGDRDGPGGAEEEPAEKGRSSRRSRTG